MSEGVVGSDVFWNVLTCWQDGKVGFVWEKERAPRLGRTRVGNLALCE